MEPEDAAAQFGGFGEEGGVGSEGDAQARGGQVGLETGGVGGMGGDGGDVGEEVFGGDGLAEGLR